MKTISVFLALVNSLLAGLVILFSLSTTEIRESTTLWLLVKVIAALLVIGIGVLAWFANKRPINPLANLLANLFLVALGTATIVWTFHLALITGDMESYMVLYGGSLMLQGAASLFSLIYKPENATIT
jgi:hypothetical protein